MLGKNVRLEMNDAASGKRAQRRMAHRVFDNAEAKHPGLGEIHHGETHPVHRNAAADIQLGQRLAGLLGLPCGDDHVVDRADGAVGRDDDAEKVKTVQDAIDLVFRLS